MIDKLTNPMVILTFLSGLKLMLEIFGVDVFSTAQAEAIANGFAALVVVIVGVIAKIQEANAKAELAEVKAELSLARMGK